MKAFKALCAAFTNPKAPQQNAQNSVDVKRYPADEQVIAQAALSTTSFPSSGFGWK